MGIILETAVETVVEEAIENGANEKEAESNGEELRKKMMQVRNINCS